MDETALVEAAPKFGGIALDVFEQEPLPKDSPLWDLENALLSSHNADTSDDWVEIGVDIFAARLEEYISGKEFSSVVDREAGY